MTNYCRYVFCLSRGSDIHLHVLTVTNYCRAMRRRLWRRLSLLRSSMADSSSYWVPDWAPLCYLRRRISCQVPSYLILHPLYIAITVSSSPPISILQLAPPSYITITVSSSPISLVELAQTKHCCIGGQFYAHLIFAFSRMFSCPQVFICLIDCLYTSSKKRKNTFSKNFIANKNA